MTDSSSPSPMAILINIDGNLGSPDELKISVLDRGFLYGDSVYEVMRTYNGKIFAPQQHFARLEQSAAGINIELPDRQWLLSEIKRTISASGNSESYCRVMVTRGIGPLTLDPTTARNPLTVIIAKEYEPFPEHTYSEGVRVSIPTIRRTSRTALDPAIKSGNYLNSVLALGEAKQAGFADALMLDQGGLVTEATSSNVFIAKNGKLLTPALEYGLLAGVTRKLLLDVGRASGFECVECRLDLEAVQSADEVMLTSTLREVQPVVGVGDAVIANGKPGPIAKKLRQRFHDFALSTLTCC